MYYHLTSERPISNAGVMSNQIPPCRQMTCGTLEDVPLSRPDEQLRNASTSTKYTLHPLMPSRRCKSGFKGHQNATIVVGVSSEYTSRGLIQKLKRGSPPTSRSVSPAKSPSKKQKIGENLDDFPLPLPEISEPLQLPYSKVGFILRSNPQFLRLCIKLPRLKMITFGSMWIRSPSFSNTWLCLKGGIVPGHAFYAPVRVPGDVWIASGGHSCAWDAVNSRIWTTLSIVYSRGLGNTSRTPGCCIPDWSLI